MISNVGGACCSTAGLAAYQQTAQASKASQVSSLSITQTTQTISFTAIAAGQDMSQLSGPAQFVSNLQDLQTSLGSSFQSMMQSLADTLSTSASQSTGGLKDFLLQLSSQFQQVADTGDLSLLQPMQSQPASTGSSGVYARNGQSAYSLRSFGTPSSDASNGVDLQAIFEMLNKQMNQTLRSMSVLSVSSTVSTMQIDFSQSSTANA